MNKTIDLQGFLLKVKNQIEIDKKKLKDNGFVIDNLDDRWQKLAFTLYTDIAALSTEAEQLLEVQLFEPQGENELGLSNDQLAYIAGLVDGEGYIGIQRAFPKDRKTPDYLVCFELAMTDRRPIDYVNSLLPKPKAITCQTRDRQLPYYRLKLTHGSALQLLKAIRPFMHVRAEKVGLCIELEELRKYYTPNLAYPNSNRFTHFSPEYVQRAEAIYSRMKALQKKPRPKTEVRNG